MLETWFARIIPWKFFLSTMKKEPLSYHKIAQMLSQTVFALSRITRRILNPWQLAWFPLSCLSRLESLKATCESVIYVGQLEPHQNSWKFNFPLSLTTSRAGSTFRETVRTVQLHATECFLWQKLHSFFLELVIGDPGNQNTVWKQQGVYLWCPDHWKRETWTGKCGIWRRKPKSSQWVRWANTEI